MHKSPFHYNYNDIDIFNSLIKALTLKIIEKWHFHTSNYIEKYKIFS